jgi:hypothetical protein
MIPNFLLAQATGSLTRDATIGFVKVKLTCQTIEAAKAQVYRYVDCLQEKNIAPSLLVLLVMGKITQCWILPDAWASLVDLGMVRTGKQEFRKMLINLALGNRHLQKDIV